MLLTPDVFEHSPPLLLLLALCRIKTMLEEAENERMHLLTFLELRQPGPLFRLMVIMAQVRKLKFDQHELGRAPASKNKASMLLSAYPYSVIQIHFLFRVFSSTCTSLPIWSAPSFVTGESASESFRKAASWGEENLA